MSNSPKNKFNTHTKNLQRRNKVMVQRFNELYKGQQLRLDVVWDRLVDEFFLSKIQIQKILREFDSKYLQDEKEDIQSE